jgi:hypothetical protein
MKKDLLRSIRSSLHVGASHLTRSLSDSELYKKTPQSPRTRRFLSDPLKDSKQQESIESALISKALVDHHTLNKVISHLDQFKLNDTQLFFLVQAHAHATKTRKLNILSQYKKNNKLKTYYQKKEELLKLLQQTEHNLASTTMKRLQSDHLRQQSCELLVEEFIRQQSLNHEEKTELKQLLVARIAHEAQHIPPPKTHIVKPLPQIIASNDGGFTAKDRKLRRPSTDKEWINRWRISSAVFYGLAFVAGFFVSGVIGLAAIGAGLGIGGAYSVAKKKLESSGGKLAASKRVKSNKSKWRANILRSAFILAGIAGLSIVLAPLAGIPVAGISMLTLAKVAGTAVASTGALVISSAILSRVMTRYYYDRYKKVSIDHWKLTEKDLKVIESKMTRYSPKQKSILMQKIHQAVDLIAEKRKKYHHQINLKVGGKTRFSLAPMRRMNKHRVLDYYKLALIKIKSGKLNYLSHFLSEEKQHLEKKCKALQNKRQAHANSSRSALLFHQALSEARSTHANSGIKNIQQHAINLAKHLHSSHQVPLNQADLDYFRQWYEYQLFLNNFYSHDKTSRISAHDVFDHRGLEAIEKDINKLNSGKNTTRPRDYLLMLMPGLIIFGGGFLAAQAVFGLAYVVAGLATVGVVYGAYEACKQTMNIITNHKPMASAIRLSAGLILGAGLVAASLLFPPLAALTISSFLSTPIILGATGLFFGSFAAKQMQRAIRLKKHKATNRVKNLLSAKELDVIVQGAHANRHDPTENIDAENIKRQAQAVMLEINRRLSSHRRFGFFNPKSFLRYFLLTGRERKHIETYQKMIFKIKNEGYPYLCHAKKELNRLNQAHTQYAAKKLGKKPTNRTLQWGAGIALGAGLVAATVFVPPIAAFALSGYLATKITAGITGLLAGAYLSRKLQGRFKKSQKVPESAVQAINNSIHHLVKTGKKPTPRGIKKSSATTSVIRKLSNQSLQHYINQYHRETTFTQKTHLIALEKPLNQNPISDKIAIHKTEDEPSKVKRKSTKIAMAVAGTAAATGAAYAKAHHGIHLPHLTSYAQGAVTGCLAWLQSKRQTKRVQWKKNPLLLFNEAQTDAPSQPQTPDAPLAQKKSMNSLP